MGDHGAADAEQASLSRPAAPDGSARAGQSLRSPADELERQRAPGWRSAGQPRRNFLHVAEAEIVARVCPGA